MEITHDHADCRVYTEREGALSAVGHDLELGVGSFHIEVEEDPFSVVGQFDAESLRVLASIDSGGSRADVSSKDRRKIEKNIRKDVLKAKKYPRVVFRGDELERTDDGFVVVGELDLRGTCNRLDVTFRPGDGAWLGEARFDQRVWNVEPYTAFFGALKIKPELRVELRLTDSIDLPWA